jgi:hypothetical protein
MKARARVASVAAAAAALAIPIGLSAGPAAASHPDTSQIQHVLLISVDGMHQSDLAWYVANHPGSALAQLAQGGREYTNDHTSDPSDSDPGGTALMTGGTRRSPVSTTTTSTTTTCSRPARRTAQVPCPAAM